MPLRDAFSTRLFAVALQLLAVTQVAGRLDPGANLVAAICCSASQVLGALVDMSSQRVGSLELVAAEVAAVWSQQTI